MDAMTTYVRDGGAFMYPIILGTLWALTLLIERTIFYLQHGADLTKQVTTFFDLLQRDGIESAGKFLATRRGLLKNVLAAALDNPSLPPERIEEKMEAVLTEQLPLYSQSLNLLASLAALMPIFGLLGTVSGMITTFRVISLHGTGDAQAMAGGIAEALITTQAGLVAAAPMMLGHVLLSARLKKIADKTREACVKYLVWTRQHHA